MKSLLLLFSFFAISVAQKDKEFQLSEPKLIDSIFNTSSLTAGVFNNSFVMIGIFFLFGIILFELALYALDVYYNQTYGFSFDKVDSEDYEDLLSGNLYNKYSPYYDYYASTYRSLGRNSAPHFKTILKLINLAHEAYEDLSLEKNDTLECTKKWMCKLFNRPDKSRSQKGKSPIYSKEKILALKTLNNLKDMKDTNEDGFCDRMYRGCTKDLSTMN